MESMDNLVFEPFGSIEVKENVADRATKRHVQSFPYSSISLIIEISWRWFRAEPIFDLSAQPPIIIRPTVMPQPWSY